MCDNPGSAPAYLHDPDQFWYNKTNFSVMEMSMTKSMPVPGSVRVAGKLADIPLREGMPARRVVQVGITATLVAGSCAMKRYPLYSTEEMKARREAVLRHGRI